MRFREFVKEFEVDDEANNFLPTKLVEGDLKSAGWKIKDVLTPANYHQKFNDLNVIITNPNFYNDGHIIAESRKSVIMASGYPIVKFNEKEYWTIDSLLRPNALERLKTMKEWEWVQVADWIIVTKKDNILLGQFDNWDNLPNRKEVEKNE